MMTNIALIPARAGSKRVVKKNTQLLNGHPLIAYSIRAAIDSHIFGRVVVSTESPEIAEIARYYGAEIPFLRPEEFAGDASPDIDWVKHTMGELRRLGSEFEAFAILRPTSPFRQAATVRRAWETFCDAEGADSVRAVEPCKQHPAKMWIVRGKYMQPVITKPEPTGVPWHSSAYQNLPPVYEQNASLEIAWTRVLSETGSIAGRTISPFFTQGWEGFDINRTEDLWLAETLVNNKVAQLPEIQVPPWTPSVIP